MGRLGSVLALANIKHKQLTLDIYIEAKASQQSLCLIFKTSTWLKLPSNILALVAATAQVLPTVRSQRRPAEVDESIRD